MAYDSLTSTTPASTYDADTLFTGVADDWATASQNTTMVSMQHAPTGEVRSSSIPPRHCCTFEIWRTVGDFLNFAKLSPQMTKLDLRLYKETIVLPLSSFWKIGPPSETDFICPTITLCAKFMPMDTSYRRGSWKAQTDPTFTPRPLVDKS